MAEQSLLRSLRFGVWLPALVSFGIVAVIWQLVAAHQQYVLPSLGSIASQFVDRPGLYWSNALTTLQEAVVGTSASFAIAMVLAILMSQLDVLERAIMPLAVVLNVTPVMSIAPALVIAFGFGIGPKYIVTAVITFFPFLVNALVGLRSADRGTLEVFQSLHASRREILFRLRLPSSLPFLFAAARVCLPLSIVGAVVAEFVAAGNEQGLGSLIATSQQSSELPPIYASVFVLAFIGLVFTAIVVLAEHRYLSWHGSRQQRGSRLR